MDTMTSAFPSTDIDLFGPDVALDPYPVYRALRDMAPVVWNSRHEYWTVTRYDDVRAGRRDPGSSA